MTAAVQSPRDARSSPPDTGSTARKVLIVAPYFPPVIGAGVYRTFRFVNYLPEFGWQPLVLSVDPGKTSDPSLMGKLDPHLFVRRVPQPNAGDYRSTTAPEQGSDEKKSAPNSPSGIRGFVKSTLPYRLLRNGWQFWSQTPDKHVAWNAPAIVAAEEIVRTERPDAVFTSGPPHSVHLIGQQLKTRYGLPWVADFRDPWARRPWGGKAENPWGQLFYPRYERRCVTLADRVILNTPGMEQDFVSHHADLPRERFACIPNGCDPELAEVVDGLLKNVPSRQPGQVVRICHPGALYRERDPRPLMQAVGSLAAQGHPVRFEQIGPHDPQFQLESFIRERGLDACVSVRGAVPHEQILGEMAAVDILVLLQPRTPIQVPGKLFEMILFGKPILALCHEGNTAELIREFALGEVADPDSADAIAKALLGLLSRDSTTQPKLESTRGTARKTFDARELTHALARQLTTVAAKR